MIKIMFVCLGNICRSPMAEFITKDLLKNRGLENEFEISSSATSAEEIWHGVGNPVYPPARAELAKHGIYCGDKRAVQLKKSDYESYDIFVAMDDNNVRNIMRIFGGDADKKVHKLMDYTAVGGDVADPWYSNRFDIAFSDIYSGCSALIEHLLGR